MRDPGTISSSTPLPRPMPPRSLGAASTRAKNADRREPPMPTGQAALAQHALCVDHVKIDGLRSRVCVVKGRDVADVIAEANELKGTRP